MADFARYAQAVADGEVCEQCLAKFGLPHNAGCLYDDEKHVGGHAGEAAHRSFVAHLRTQVR